MLTIGCSDELKLACKGRKESRMIPSWVFFPLAFMGMLVSKQESAWQSVILFGSVRFEAFYRF